MEIAKILAADLGIDAGGRMTWMETISDNREPYLQEGKVDLVIATYSITPERRSDRRAGRPYFVTGQQILVKEDSDITEHRGPARARRSARSRARPRSRTSRPRRQGARGFDTYFECVEQVLNGTVEAMSTDGAILPATPPRTRAS